MLQGQAGRVVSFDPERQMYQIAFDHHGTLPARMLNTGVITPFEPQTRVLCLRLPGAMEWSVLGEIALPTPAAPDPVLDDTRLAAAPVTAIDGTNPARHRTGDNDVLFPPPDVGDRIISSPSGGKLGMFKGGSIVVQATEFCLAFFDRLRNKITLRFRELLASAVGFVFRTKNPKPDRVEVHVDVRAVPNEAADVTLRAGALPADATRFPTGASAPAIAPPRQGRAARGLSMRIGPNLFFEADSEVGEARLTWLNGTTGRIVQQVRMNEGEFTVWRPSGLSANNRTPHEADQFWSLTSTGLVQKATRNVVAGAVTLSPGTGITHASGAPAAPSGGTMAFDAASGGVSFLSPVTFTALEGAGQTGAVLAGFLRDVFLPFVENLAGSQDAGVQQAAQAARTAITPPSDAAYKSGV